jgi:cytochrome c-type biogenesis protein CcmH/NrfG
MGFVLLGGLLLLTIAALWWFGKLRGAALQLTAAALMLGAAGYALQGRPSLPSSPQGTARDAAPLPLTVPREAMLGQFTGAARWLNMSDSFARRGNRDYAVGIIQAGLKQYPRDVALWVGLGNALVDHAGMVTPAARLAYARAREVAPKHPAPLFFEGLALARSGEREEALGLWRRALALTPPETSYRPMIEQGIAALQGQAPQAPPRG